jgi:hypothetical protein
LYIVLVQSGKYSQCLLFSGAVPLRTSFYVMCILHSQDLGPISLSHTHSLAISISNQQHYSSFGHHDQPTGEKRGEKFKGWRGGGGGGGSSRGGRETISASLNPVQQGRERERESRSSGLLGLSFSLSLLQLPWVGIVLKSIPASALVSSSR